ncbi:Uncharacterized protein APZ42_026580 [Daphnia magna]|uniref:Uncharacterized protein n=2 Tax=Daphnia magna TaxID=35525 RepID=A0A164S4S3_9CRUS|nr:hypothetical protein OUZ56_017083 [Daphnia magna]KZS09248.1 Uncharacterized protein APZ42_026580 [Daphnia magna]
MKVKESNVVSAVTSKRFKEVRSKKQPLASYYTTMCAALTYFTEAPKHYSAQYYTTNNATPSYYIEALKYHYLHCPKLYHRYSCLLHHNRSNQAPEYYAPTYATHTYYTTTYTAPEYYTTKAPGYYTEPPKYYPAPSYKTEAPKYYR